MPDWFNPRQHSDIRAPDERVERCSVCRGARVVTCEECDGQGSFLVDGAPVLCSCMNGKVKCSHCDGTGVEQG